MKKKVVRSSIVVAILVAIEMVIKIIIDVFFMEKKLIFFEQFGFKPHLNTTQLSMFNNELDMGVSTAALIVLNIALILLVPVGLYLLHRGRGTHPQRTSPGVWHWHLTGCCALEPCQCLCVEACAPLPSLPPLSRAGSRSA